MSIGVSERGVMPMGVSKREVMSMGVSKRGGQAKVAANTPSAQAFSRLDNNDSDEGIQRVLP